jgi:hypothetical protein
MEISGMQGSGNLQAVVAVISQQRKLMELQGAMLLKLIESAAVTSSPDNNISNPGLGVRFDIRV